MTGLKGWEPSPPGGPEVVKRVIFPGVYKKAKIGACSPISIRIPTGLPQGWGLCYQSRGIYPQRGLGFPDHQVHAAHVEAYLGGRVSDAGEESQRAVPVPARHSLYASVPVAHLIP